MKAIRNLMAIALFVGFAFSSHAAQRDTLRILAIANSFGVDAVEQNLHSIAEADGICLIIGNMYIGGCSLERHYNNSVNNTPDYSYRKINQWGVRSVTPKSTLEQALADEAWDIVTFQQSSPLSGKPESYEPFLTDLIKYVSARVPSTAVFYWHQTWSYARDSKHKAFPDYDSDQMVMYQCIMDASSQACRNHALAVIPCGTTMQNVRGTFVGDTMNRDGYHLSKSGRYAAACTWYETICNADVRGNSFRPQYVSEEEVMVIQKAAHAAVRKPFKISKIK